MFALIIPYHPLSSLIIIFNIFTHTQNCCENSFTNQVKWLPHFWWSHLVPGTMVLSKSRRRLQRLERQKRSERRRMTRMTRGWLWHGYGSDGYHMDCDLWHVDGVYDVFVSMKEIERIQSWRIRGYIIFWHKDWCLSLCWSLGRFPEDLLCYRSGAANPTGSRAIDQTLGYIGIPWDLNEFTCLIVDSHYLTESHHVAAFGTLVRRFWQTRWDHDENLVSIWHFRSQWHVCTLHPDAWTKSSTLSYMPGRSCQCTPDLPSGDSVDWHMDQLWTTYCWTIDGESITSLRIATRSIEDEIIDFRSTAWAFEITTKSK